MKNTTFHTVQFLLLCIFFSACNTTKYVGENQHLLKENTININGKKSNNLELNAYLLQKPNNRLLNIPIGLNIYNLGQKNYDSIHKVKSERIINRTNPLDKILSKKQIIGFYNGKRNINNWFFEYGEKPTIEKPEQTLKSAQNLREVFFNRGYFNSKINVSPFYDDKSVSINYNITTNKPFTINQIDYNINDPQIHKLLKKQLLRLPLNVGDQFDIEKLKTSREIITAYLRNHGYYHFDDRSISFKKIDTLSTNNTTPIELVIENRKIEKNNQILELPYQKQTIESVNVYTDYSYANRNEKYDQITTYKNIHFFARQKLKHSKKVLANAIFIKPGSYYSDQNIELTRKQLKSLNNFKSIKINHKELPNNKLETNIILTPLKKYAIGLNSEIIHSNIKQIGISGGFSFINRNLFKGAEVFKLNTQGSIFDTAISDNNAESFNAYEVGIDASIEFPKIVFPFLSNILSKKHTPKTKLIIGTSFQENIGLDRQNFNGGINYNWNPSRNNTHSFDLINLQLIENLNPDSYFNIYNSEFQQIKNIQTVVDPSFDLTTENALTFINNLPSDFANTNPDEFNALQNIANRQNIITSNFFIPATSYSFEHNNRKGLNDNNYNYFRGKVSSSGNIISTFLEEVNNEKVFRNVAVSQFLKFDIDFRNFWKTSTHNSIAFRTFAGVIIPTGKTQNIPFVSSYFAGGSNDLRAWRAYEIGPGSSNSGLEFNIGNVKLLSSIEYRFKVINSIHGAMFIDAGNVWNLPDTDTATENEIFENLSSLKNIAIGSGIGLRYNLGFVVLRFDLAFKTYEPYLENNKWFSNYNINNSILNLGINYPF